MKLKLLLLSGLLYISSLSYSQIPACTFGSVNFTQSGTGLTKTCAANTPGLSGTLSYTWKYNGTAVGYSSTQNFTFSTTGPNMVCLEVVSIYQDSLRLTRDTCQLTYCDSLTNSTTPPPPPPGPCTGKNLTVSHTVSGAIVTFTATHPGYMSSNITWHNGIPTLGTGTTYTSTFTVGTHVICAKATLIIYDSMRFPIDTCIHNFCDTVTITTTSLVENNTINSLKLYPNPAKDNITISYSSNVETKGFIIITDLLGKTVLHKNTEFNSNTKSKEKIDVSTLSNGSYLIRIMDARNRNFISKPIKFVKQ